MKPLTVSICLAAVGCGGVADPVPVPPEDRGRLLTSAIGVSYLSWSPDGSEVVFIGDMLYVMAVPVRGGATRTLYSSTTSLVSIAVAANNVYVSVPNSGNNGGFRLVRLPWQGGAPDTILSWPGTLRTYQFAVSSDERFVAFGDTLYDRVNQARRALPRGVPWSFSSDGSLLLWEAELSLGQTELRMISTANMASQTLLRPAATERHNSVTGVHYWSGNDPFILHIPFVPGSQTVKPFLFNARTGADREVASLAAYHGVTSSDVSADGARVVVWTGPRWTQLHSIDAATGSYDVRSTVSRDSILVNDVRLSPDARKAAYLMYDGQANGVSGIPRMYVVDVAP